jgi:hypothetical protein
LDLELVCPAASRAEGRLIAVKRRGALELVQGHRRGHASTIVAIGCAPAVLGVVARGPVRLATSLDRRTT